MKKKKIVIPFFVLPIVIFGAARPCIREVVSFSSVQNLIEAPEDEKWVFSCCNNINKARDKGIVLESDQLPSLIGIVARKELKAKGVRVEATRALMRAGVNPDRLTNGLAPAHILILKSCEIDAMDALLLKGDSNARSAYGLSPLALLLTKVAAKKDEKKEMPKELEMAKFFCSKKDIQCISPFHTLRELLDGVARDDSNSRKNLITLIQAKFGLPIIEEAAQQGHTVKGVYYRHTERLIRIEKILQERKSGALRDRKR